MADAVTLTIGGQRHNGWTAVNVTRAIDTMCGSFRLTLTYNQPRGFALEAGAACIVQVAGETLITGHIDTLSPSLVPDSRTIEVAGRDRTADLVDCSAVMTPGSWRDTSIEAIAAALAQPFGISVTAKAPTGPKLRRFAIQQGETIQAAIERLCRFAGLLAVSNAAGELELIVPTRAAPVIALVEGGNILSGSADHDVSQRFSRYVVKGQSAGDDHANGKTVSQPRGTATDPAVMRYRPLLVIGEEQTTLANAGMRAQWEATTRAGRAQSAIITVRGWRDAAGALLRPNTMADVDAPTLFMRGRMLIQAVSFKLDQRGTVAELTVTPPEAWSQLAIPERTKASRVERKKAA
ncbi:phage baseplate assembly protein [Sphingomonas sp. TX0522]|uniref:phage baseplate assembly protein n=1 Tax=Sphingomonas sp. TX0522 TaxID=2479205 RepID=UPI0018DF2B2C